MYKHPNLIVGCLLAALITHAQGIPLLKPTGDSLIRKDVVQLGRHSAVVYTSNGYLLSDRELMQKLTSYAPSASEYKKYKIAQTGSFVFLGMAVGSSIGFATEPKNYSSTGKSIFIVVASSA